MLKSMKSNKASKGICDTCGGKLDKSGMCPNCDIKTRGGKQTKFNKKYKGK